MDNGLDQIGGDGKLRRRQDQLDGETQGSKFGLINLNPDTQRHHSTTPLNDTTQQHHSTTHRRNVQPHLKSSFPHSCRRLPCNIFPCYNSQCSLHPHRRPVGRLLERLRLRAPAQATQIPVRAGSQDPGECQTVRGREAHRRHSPLCQ